VTSKAALPVLVFDGDCGFCTTCARFLARWVVAGHRVSVVPWQRLDLAELGLTADRCRAAVQWVAEGGQVATGHAAMAAALRAGQPVWRPVGALILAPGFSCLAKWLYSWIAGHRDALPGGTPACQTDGTGPGQ
jgi:predicted DCC family thiol-disulfide oxidoreductase YuxK